MRTLLLVAVALVGLSAVARADLIEQFNDPFYAMAGPTYTWPWDTSLPGAIGTLRDDPDSDSFVNVGVCQETDPTGYLLLNPRNHLLDERLLLQPGYLPQINYAAQNYFGDSSSGGSPPEDDYIPPPIIPPTPIEIIEQPVVPEPASLGLIVAGLAMVLRKVNRRREGR